MKSKHLKDIADFFRKNTVLCDEPAASTSYCPICKNNSEFKPFGSPPRKNARCPHCNSLERHRAIFKTYEERIIQNKNTINVLHTAPEVCLAEKFIEADKISYYPTDLCPEKYKNISCCRADVTDLCFKDNFFDFVISHHILEHIIDEEQCLKEFLRVLKNGGILFLNIPISRTLEKTYEDPTITEPEERLKHFGQEDHVRKYGMDIIDKLQDKYNAKVHHLDGEILFEIVKN